MCRVVFLVLFGILCLSSKSVLGMIETLMDNVVVLRVRQIDGSSMTVPLSCGGAFENEPVTWKKNGMPKPDLQGNNIRVTVREWGGGNYTCHLGPDGPYLNHTVIMVQLNPDNRSVILQERGHEEGFIHCSTPNYRGSFQCAWTRRKERSDAAVLLVRGHRNQETIPCTVDASGSGIRCEDNVCPYKEEQHHISLTVYMHSVFRLEAYTKVFYLREIVTPGRLPNLHHINGSVFKWDYPDSWEKPCSYFSLLFQVKAVHNGDLCDSEEHILAHTNTSKPEYQINFKTKKFVFCVRAQDKHTGGPWSHWSRCTVNKNTDNSHKIHFC